MTTDTLNLDRLRKAQATFERFRKNMQDDRDQAGAVQAFEFCYELAWKCMKRVLSLRGFEIGSPKETFRKAAIEKLIDNPEVWFEFQKKRNLTVHVYEQEILEEVVAVFDHFSQELNTLIQRLESLTI
jgi:nucleotidyltransferase substrate binding protein (TIGR01987 family)